MSSTPEPNNPVRRTPDRLLQISQVRQAVLQEGRSLTATTPQAWIERSWQRCLQLGLQPQQAVSFDLLPAPLLRRTQEANRHLVESARPVLESLGQAILNTRYFAILTNAQGVVVDVSGQIDRSDPRANLITRIGTDLSESRVGTTAIGAALSELRPVWLHRGEHFFADTSVYSCAGAPLFGPDGACVGMLDLTGVDVIERPELTHLVSQSAHRIQNALVLALAHALTVRLSWPGTPPGSEADGLLCLDADGWITGANTLARNMVPDLDRPGHPKVHASEVFGLPYDRLFDASQRAGEVLELPLWSGLRLQAVCVRRAHQAACAPTGAQTRPQTGVTGVSGTPGDARPRATPPLKDMQTALIRQAVLQAHGNVTEAARALGISRATVYRKIASGRN